MHLNIAPLGAKKCKECGGSVTVPALRFILSLLFSMLIFIPSLLASFTVVTMFVDGDILSRLTLSLPLGTAITLVLSLLFHYKFVPLKKAK